MRSASAAPVSAGCGITSAAPSRASASAFFRWWSSVAVGNGTSTAGRPATVSSASVVAPARADDQVGISHLAVHLVQERLDPRLQARARVALSHRRRDRARPSGA